MDALGTEASRKEARITLDTGLAGRSDASNPAQLRLAALSACMIKGIERVAPIIKFAFRGVEVRLAGVRQESPPRMARIDYEILIDTDEPDRKLELLQENVRRFGTVFNTVAPGTALTGTRRRGAPGEVDVAGLELLIWNPVRARSGACGADAPRAFDDFAGAPVR